MSLLSMEAQWPSHRAPSVETQLMCALMFKSSHRPDGKCLVDMSVSILIFDDGCYLDPPVWSTCHLRLKNQKFPSPDGKGADALASTLACTTATDASVNYRMYVPDAETL